YRLAAHSPEATFGNAATGASRMRTIIGLVNGTAYDVRVRANNAAGSSAWERIDDVTPIASAGLAGPTITSALIFDTFWRASWTYSPPAGHTSPARYDSEILRVGTQGGTTFDGTWANRVTRNPHTNTVINVAGLTRAEVRARAYVTPTGGNEQV
ncbi:MAG: hypothetical protein OXG72_14320, partial [Acidobacteria bacterium]|nr:hypothetical protein [Acidobacteriota bacterium]